MAKATLFALIAVAAALIIYLIAAPRLAAPQASGTNADTRVNLDKSAPAPGASASPGRPDVDSAPPIEAPLTPEQRSQADLELRRSPLYAWIKANLQSYLDGYQPAQADPAILNLYLSHGDDAAVSLCMSKLVEPFASKYGFNHVCFYFADRSSDVSQWRLDSEATTDTGGGWHLYKK